MIALLSFPLSASTVTWNGAAGDGSVSDGGNWVGGTAAPSGSDLVFASDTGGGGGIVGFDASITFNAPTVTFSAGAPAFTVTAASASDILNITGTGTALTNSSSFLQTSNLITIQVGAATQTWDGGASGLSISAIDLQNNHILTLAGMGTGSQGNVVTQKITGTGTSGIVKTGTGTLTLNNTLANDYTGQTTVAGGTLIMTGANSGTGAFTIDGAASVLKLGASNRIATGSAITLSNGGTLNLNGFHDTVGTLTGGSPGKTFIDFGAGSTSASIAFANSSAQSWLGQLHIENFNTGDTLPFGNSSSGLTGTELSNLFFDSGTATDNTGTQIGQISAVGVVTPTTVPEPGGALLAAFGLLPLLACRRRGILCRLGARRC